MGARLNSAPTIMAEVLVLAADHALRVDGLRSFLFPAMSIPILTWTMRHLLAPTILLSYHKPRADTSRLFSIADRNLCSRVPISRSSCRTLGHPL